MRFAPPAVFAALLGLVALLAGCCANTTCDCQDLLEDAIQFRLRIGDPATDPTSFLPAEVDTIRLVRYRPSVKDVQSTAPPTVYPPDTVVLTFTAAQADTRIDIANTRPFAVNGALRVNAYRYAVLLTSGRRRNPQVRQRFDFGTVRLKGGFEANGCCTCYRNEAKSAWLRTAAPNSNVPAPDSSFLDLSPRQVVELSRRP